MNGSGKAQTTWVLNEDEALELLAFLVTAARTQVDEAPEYGPMRLMMAAARLVETLQSRATVSTRTFLTSVADRMPGLATPMSDAQDYGQRLDALCAALAAYLDAHFRTGGSQ